jgi:hypothetical protein
MYTTELYWKATLFSVHFMTLSRPDYIAQSDWTTDERWIGNYLEGSSRGLIEIVPRSPHELAEENHKILPAEVRTEHLRSIKLQRYCHTNQLCGRQQCIVCRKGFGRMVPSWHLLEESEEQNGNSHTRQTGRHVKWAPFGYNSRTLLLN